MKYKDTPLMKALINPNFLEMLKLTQTDISFGDNIVFEFTYHDTRYCLVLYNNGQVTIRQDFEPGPNYVAMFPFRVILTDHATTVEEFQKVWATFEEIIGRIPKPSVIDKIP